MARLQEKFKSELVGEIQQKLGLKNPMQVPKITKITLNMGVGDLRELRTNRFMKIISLAPEVL